MAAEKLYHPPKHFSEKAGIASVKQYEELYEQASADPEGFWGKLAETELDWFKKWSAVLDWSEAPFAKWFVGGQLNMSYNCLDRHLTTWPTRSSTGASAGSLTP
jgi:acetyl-CoA synthetase